MIRSHAKIIIPVRFKKVLLWVVELLEKNNIEYELTGGLAARCYGAKRKIYDIDIDLRIDVLEKIARLVPETVIDGPRNYQEDGFKVRLLTLKKNGVRIDLSVAGDEKILNQKTNKWQHFATNWRDSHRVNIDGQAIKIISREELITYKKALSRPIDVADLKALEY